MLTHTSCCGRALVIHLTVKIFYLLYLSKPVIDSLLFALFSVPESAKPSSSQPLATPGSVSPSPGPVPPSSPCPGATGVSTQVPPGGGNNAKQRTAVANGQPSSSSSSGSQTSQQQRYMPREVPPRFRCQQDHKVLLKRGQPPLSSMLLGGGGEGGGAGSGWVATPPLSSQGADNPNAIAAGATGGSIPPSEKKQVVHLL